MVHNFAFFRPAKMEVLTCSIVVFKPDPDLLESVIEAFFAACAEAGLADTAVAVDLIDNDAAGYGRLVRRPSWPDRVRLIAAPANRGYGAGNNLSILDSAAEFHLVLNPDAILAGDAIRRALDILRARPEVGLLVPQVRGFDGAMHYLCKRNPSLFDLFLRGFASAPVKRLFARRMAWFEMREHDYDQPICPVPFPTGCCMFFRGDLLRSLGGFDERFFLYLEDADIGRRVNRVARVAYEPSVRVRHQWQRGSHNRLGLRWQTIRSGFYYWRKWGGVWRGTSEDGR